MRCERYVDYKKSGISLVPYIPLEWESKPLKFIADCNSRVLSESTDEGAKITYIDIGSVNYGQGVCNTQEFTFANAPSRARRVVKSGDTIISTVRTYLKAIAYISDEYDSYICSTGFAVFTPKKGVNSRFLFYALNADWFVSDVERHSVGISYPAITSTALSSLKTILPTFDEQEKIVAYLDRRTAKIDGLLADLHTQARMLERYKREFIARTVTKGIDKAAPMKDSGVDWIGEIPVHWELIKARWVFKQRNSKGNENEVLLSATQKFGMFPQDEIEGTVKVKADTNLQLFKTVHKNDFVISLRSFQGGFEISDYEGVCSPAYQVFYNATPICHRFYKWLFKSIPFIDKMNSITTGIREGRNIPYEAFAQCQIPVPPITEQEDIAQHLDKRLTLIDGLIADINEQIEKLKQYRKIVIHYAVTGKIKVTEG